jgi:hypothetical protein
MQFENLASCVLQAIVWGIAAKQLLSCYMRKALPPLLPNYQDRIK